MNYIENIYKFTQIKRNMIIDYKDDSLADNLDASTLWPGYFGKDYFKSKMIIIAHYPAGGTTSYEIPTIDDRKFYDSIIEFKNSNIKNREILFNKMNDFGRRYIPQWSIYSIMNVLFDYINIKLDDIIYFNAIPFRIPNNRPPRVLEKNNSWKLYTERMINIYRPNIIVCLGMATGKIINMNYSGHSKIFTLRRRIGDKSIDPEVYSECEIIKNYFSLM